jgi:hypothetical protein
MDIFQPQSTDMDAHQPQPTDMDAQQSQRTPVDSDEQTESTPMAIVQQYQSTDMDAHQPQTTAMDASFDEQEAARAIVAVSQPRARANPAGKKKRYNSLHKGDT